MSVHPNEATNRLSLRAPVRSDTRETAPTEEGQKRVRRRRGTYDPYAIPLDMVPEGMTWEWKRVTNAGQPDPSHMANLVANGWEGVDSARVASLAAPGATGPHVVNGMMLMERPTYLCEEAREEELSASLGRARQLEQQMGVSNPGELPRFTGRAPGGKAVTRSYENMARVAVPD